MKTPASSTLCGFCAEPLTIDDDVAACTCGACFTLRGDFWDAREPTSKAVAKLALILRNLEVCKKAEALLLTLGIVADIRAVPLEKGEESGNFWVGYVQELPLIWGLRVPLDGKTDDEWITIKWVVGGIPPKNNLGDRSELCCTTCAAKGLWYEKSHYYYREGELFCKKHYNST